MSTYRIISMLLSWAVERMQWLFALLLAVCTVGSFILFRKVRGEIRGMNTKFDKEKYQRKNNGNNRYRK